MAKKPRVIGHASEIEEPFRRCTCCDRPLVRQVAWLELDQRTNTFHDEGNVPADQSQGWFPFGMTCAAKANGQTAEPTRRRTSHWARGADDGRTQRHRSQEEMLATAHLLHDAPALLAEVKRLREALEDLIGLSPSHPFGCACQWCRAKGALARAALQGDTP